MKYASFKEVDAAADLLYDQEQYAAVVALMDEAMQCFPEMYVAAAVNKIVMLCELADYPACLEVVRTLVQRGDGCSLHWKMLAPLKELPGYAEVEAENNRLMEKTLAEAQMRYVVHLPEGYTPEQRWPVFFVLHGDGFDGNLGFQTYYWEPQVMLRHGMIAVYVQSSQPYTPTGFGWLKDYGVAKRELRACFEQVCAQYAVDLERVYIGGFSGGAIMSTEIALAQDLPVKSYVGLCPERRPPAFTHENVLLAKQRGLRAVIMEGEETGLLPGEQEMVALFDEVGIPYEVYINPGIEHAFPLDFSEKLDRAITFITRPRDGD